MLWPPCGATVQSTPPDKRRCGGCRRARRWSPAGRVTRRPPAARSPSAAPACPTARTPARSARCGNRASRRWPPCLCRGAAAPMVLASDACCRADDVTSGSSAPDPRTSHPALQHHPRAVRRLHLPAGVLCGPGQLSTVAQAFTATPSPTPSGVASPTPSAMPTPLRLNQTSQPAKAVPSRAADDASRLQMAGGSKVVLAPTLAPQHRDATPVRCLTLASRACPAT